jgi:hypothetical protein
MVLESHEIAQLLSPDNLAQIRIWAEQCAVEYAYMPDPLEANSQEEEDDFRLWRAPVLEMQKRHRVWIEVLDLDMGVLVEWGLYGLSMVTVYERGDDGLIAMAPLDAYQERLGMKASDLDALIPALQKAREITRVFEATYVAAGGRKARRTQP